MARGAAGPFLSQRFTADTAIAVKPAWLWSYTITNTSGGAITVTFYDDAAGGTTNPIETVILANNTTQAIYPNGDTLNGLTVKSTSWAGGTSVSVRWAPR
jgi:hypothetical protein